MRKPVKTIKNLQKRDYVNMYIVYLFFKKILKFCKILRNIVIICKKLPPVIPEGIIRYKLGTGLHCFYLPYFAIFCNTFRNILKFLSKYFEIFRNISKYSKYFASIAILSKDFGMQFLSKISYIYFADVLAGLQIRT